MAFRSWVLGVTGLVVAGCVSDPEVEDEVPPNPGAVQPKSTGGAKLSADAACTRLVDAEKGARDRLGCEMPDGLECPGGYARLAGGTPCGEYDESTVDACVEAMDGFENCSDFSRRPCIATVVAASCTPPVLPDAGPDADAGADADAGLDAEAGPGDGGVRDGSEAAPPPDGDAAEAGPDAPGEASTTTDAGDASPD